MILGMTTFTFVHVLLSLIGIAAGFVVMFGLWQGRRLNGWTAVFLSTTVLTNLTGFGFPFDRFLPSHGIAIASLVILAIVIPARYLFRMTGGWRPVYVIGAMSALYFNVFVLIVQLFLKVPALQALAPTQSEGPFLLAQLLALVFFAVATRIAVRRFRERDVRPPRPAAAPAHRPI